MSNFIPIWVFAEDSDSSLEWDKGTVTTVDDWLEINSDETDKSQSTDEGSLKSPETSNNEVTEEINNPDSNDVSNIEETQLVDNDNINEWNSESEISEGTTNDSSFVPLLQMPSTTTSVSNTEECFSFTIIGDWVLTWVEVLNNNCDTVRIPDTVKTISEWAWFWNLDSSVVSKIIVPDSVTTLKKWAFYSLPSEIEIELGQGIKYIEDQAFQIAYDKYTSGEKRYFSKIDLPNVSSIWKLAFQYAEIDELAINWDDEWLTIVELAFQDAKIKNIKLNNVSKIETTAFIRVKNVESIAITWNNDWATIDNIAFQGMETNWEADLVLANMDYIWSWAFHDSYSRPTFNNINISFIDDSEWMWQQSFANMSANNVIINNAKNIGWLAFQWVTINDKLTVNWSSDWAVISENAFWQWYFKEKWSSRWSSVNSSIKEIELNNINEIVRWAFKDVQNIDNIRIYWTWDGLSIWDNAFENTKINSWVYMDNVSYLWSWVFIRTNSDIDNLIITWSSNWLTIATYAFQSYSHTLKIKNLKLENVNQINKWAFQYVQDIDTLTINWTGDWLKIQDNAFEWIKVNSVNIDNVSRIWSWVFCNMHTPVESLTITWVANGFEIADYAFQNNGWLSIGDIKISNLSKLGKWAFQRVAGINNLNIVWIENWVIIGESSFQNANINNINITNAKEIWKWSFQSVTNLDKVNIEWVDSGLNIEESSFQYPKASSVNLTNVSNIWKYAFQVASYMWWVSNLTDLNIACVDAWCTIQDFAFEWNSKLEDFTIQSNWNLELWDYAFFIQNGQPNWKLKSFTLSWNISNLKIGDSVFQNNSLTWSIRLPSSLTEIGNYAFLWNQLEKVILFENVWTIWSWAFDWETKVLITRDLDTVDYKYDINIARWYYVRYKANAIGYDDFDDVIEKWTKIESPYKLDRPWYDLIWLNDTEWEPFDFLNTVIESDVTLDASWKSLEKKSEETNSNIAVLNNTTVSIGNIDSENLDESSNLQLVSEEINKNKVNNEESKIMVNDSEIEVTSNNVVQYQWWLDVFVEDNNVKLDWTAIFSHPIAVKIPVSESVKSVKVKVKHGSDEFWYVGLTTNPVNRCIDWKPENDQYNWSDISVVSISWLNYATIYTCSASSFVAYTEKAKVYPSAWGWRSINTISNTQEQEHNSADINEQTENKVSTTTSDNTVTVEENIKKYGNIKLTRWEVAVMTNILLDVFPQLVEWKQELDDVENACSNYADEQNFTKSEKKAIARLCKLSIMWIHADDNRPLEEFLVNKNTTNDEFSKVINRSISTYNEKDLSSVKDALKKLENNEDDVVFWTLYDMFMSIKNVLN